MPDVFVDTSGWGNLVDPSQPFHPVAAAIYRTARQQSHEVVTTNYVLTEVVALLTRPLRVPRPRVIAFVEGLRTSPSSRSSMWMRHWIRTRGNCC